MTKTPVRLLDLFRYYKGLPHQMAALAELEAAMPASLLTRDNAWFKTWSQDGKSSDPSWMGVALQFIKRWEGLELEAYKDAVGVWTIGYGTTMVNGSPVRQGDKISAQLADELLAEDLKRRHARLVELIPAVKNYGANQTAALLSWAYNVGMGAVEESTLRKRINAGQGAQVVVAEELPRWNKGDGKELAGLTNRRAAEVQLFRGGAAVETQQQPAKLSPSSPFTARLTPHIQLGEFALWQEVRRFHHQYQVDTAAELAAFMERCRVQFGGKPVVITSGYRPPAINRSVGGASGSEHLFDAPGVGAVDFYIKDTSIKAVQDWCDKNWPYSLGYGAPKGFVHLGIRRGRPRVRWDY
jgi:GH24 family phage-related lysozyme (muramidase)